jgi:hypothetical protein
MIIHLHSSSKFNRSPRSLKSAFDSYVQYADILTLTEVEFENRERVLRSNKNWRMFSGDKSNKNDSAIVWVKSKYDFVYGENFLVSRGWSGGQDLYATFVVLMDDLEDREIVVGCLHLPSGVEGDLLSKKRTVRTIAWYRAFRAYTKRANKLRRKFKAKGVVLAADWNVNFKKKAVRIMMKALAPQYSLTWKKFGKSGTHGNRVIDGTLIKGRLKIKRPATLFKDDNSSDHRPYREILTFK